MIRFSIILILVLAGCAMPKKIPPPPDPPSVPAKILAFEARSAMAIPPAPIPPGLYITGITPVEAGLRLTWNSGGEFTVECAPGVTGPWSAIGIFDGGEATVPLYSSNRLYRLSQSYVNVERYWMGGRVGPMVGNNEIAFALHDYEWWEGPDYLMSLTNEVFIGFPLWTEGMAPCVPLAAAVDTSTWKYWTAETECYHGGLTGPFTVREWQLVGENGFFTNALQISSDTFGKFGDSFGDMIRLSNGSLVFVWRDSAATICFAYRKSAVGQWQELCVPIAMWQGSMVLGEHPDGTVYCGLSIDASHLVTLVAFKQQAGQLMWSSTVGIPSEGEWAHAWMVPDWPNNRLILSRPIFESYSFSSGEGQLTRRGVPIQSVYIYSEVSRLYGPKLPDPASTPGSPLWALTSMEAVNVHASILSGGTQWIIRQEYQPMTGRFSSVYATPFESDHWGERQFIYRAPDCDNCRGLAHNLLTSYRNSDKNPSRILFGNLDENGEATIFELK